MEMVAFVQAGPEGFARFRQIRMSCVSAVSGPPNTFHNTRSLKASVQTWLNDLHSDPDYREMSVCIQSVVQPKQQDRPTAREVFERT